VIHMSIVAIADMFGTGDGREELLTALARVERDAINQPGCLRYSFPTKLTEPNHFVLISEWRTRRRWTRTMRRPNSRTSSSHSTGCWRETAR